MEEDSLSSYDFLKLGGCDFEDDFSLPNPLYHFFQAVKPSSSISDADLLVEKKETELDRQLKKEAPPAQRSSYQPPPILQIDDQSEPENMRKAENGKGKC